MDDASKITMEQNKHGWYILKDSTSSNNEVLLTVLPEPDDDWEPTNLAIIAGIRNSVIYNG